MERHLIVVTCSDSGHEALYVNGTLRHQDETIYATDIAEWAKDGPIQFSHMVLRMPDYVDDFPEQFEQCLLWPVES